MFDLFGYGANGYAQGQKENEQNKIITQIIRNELGSSECKHCNGTGYSNPTNPQNMPNIEIRTK